MQRPHFVAPSRKALPWSVSFLPGFLPLTFSSKPADSACCRITLIIFPPLFLNSGGLAPLSFLPPYLVLNLSTPTTLFIYICLRMLAVLLCQKSSSSTGLCL